MIIIKSIIRKKHFKTHRAQLKGARKLRKENRPYFVEKILHELANVSLGLGKNDFPSSLVGAHGIHAEILLRQILLLNRREICSGIMQSIGSKKPAIIPIPFTWVCSLESIGIHVNHIGCRFSLYKFIVRRVLKGIFKTVLLLIQFKLPSFTEKLYVVFVNLTPENIPKAGNEKSYDIISWYNQSKIKNPEIKEIWAHVKTSNIHQIFSDIYICNNIFPRFKKLSDYINFLLKSCISIIVTLTGIILGRWWYGFLYQESVLFHYINSLDNQDLAKEYYISHSSCWIKPLWTYEAEKKDSNVSVYYYSANIEKFQWKYLRSNSGFYNNMRWKNFIVWDTYQKEFLKQYCPEASYQVVGSIDYVDSYGMFKTDPLKFTIAIFDVTPTRPVFYTSYGMAIAPYWSEELVIQFFNDIVEIIDPNDVELYWKQKRFNPHLFTTKGFVKKRDQIINKHIIAIDPRTPAKKLIERSNAVITIPFTSTAIIGKEYNKPSIYYDASGTIDKKKYHGIPLIKNKIDLQNWYYSLNI